MLTTSGGVSIVGTAEGMAVGGVGRPVAISGRVLVGVSDRYKVVGLDVGVTHANISGSELAGVEDTDWAVEEG
jgi:hypothetical protein